MQSVDLGDIPSTYVQRLLEYDLKILNAFKATSRPHGNPILGHRLHGLHPPYDPPMLWHHWMHVWTMIAAREDEEDYVRKLHGLDPLVWFVRRQVWFIDRRPWLSRVRTFDDLVRRATGYAPITCAESACQNAIDDLKTRNWLVDVDGNLHLTELGMKTCDRDEKEVDEHFLSSWPLLSDLEIEELNQITNRMNERFVFIVEQIREA